MIREKALKKILVTSITLLILLTIYGILNIDNKNLLNTDMEVSYIENNVGTNNIYLLNDNNLLVRTKCVITDKKKEDKIKSVINKLIENNDNTYSDLRKTIPKGTKVLSVIYDEKYVTINFSKEILKVSSKLEDSMFESIVYSIFDLGDIDGVYLQVEGKLLINYPNKKEKINYPLTKKIGINKEYDISKRDSINKVVVYYLENINDNNYYVPVTKYINNTDDKIKVIIDNLTTNYIYEPNLMSFLNSNAKLNSYNEFEDVFFLDFNSNLYDKNNKVLEEVIYSISYSIFDNYDVKAVSFSVDGNNIKTVSVDDISKY